MKEIPEINKHCQLKIKICETINIPAQQEGNHLIINAVIMKLSFS